ncbi:MAG: small multi-drug export protein [Candidatus Thermoplasmatota archaeon]|nr:small multi-drug export protein [Candidatus Thermoplasmatota archaeon]
MEFVYIFVVVYALGIVELWAAIPVGVAMGVHPVATAAVATLGAMTGVLFVSYLGEHIRSSLVNRYRTREKAKRTGRMWSMWQKYGVAGFGLLAPLLVGPLFGAAFGISLGVSRVRLILWMGVGVLTWSTIIAILSGLGLLGVESLFK